MPFPASIVIVTENDELLTSILLLLPTKSVTRFKCVSKHWLSLISHPSFTFLHTALSPPQPPSSLLFPHPKNSSLFHSIPLKNTMPRNFTNDPFTSLNFTNDPSGEIEVVQSCNGLFLCSSETPWDGIDTRIFYIYNPTTKKFITLPPAPPTNDVSLTFFTKINLAFDPWKSRFYKVLLVRKADRGTSSFRVDIYCSRIGAWRECRDQVEWPRLEVFCKGVYVNGAVHWASKCDGFVCFDLERECFEKMPMLPDFSTASSTIRYLGESSGKLYLVDARGFKFHVFEVRNDYSGWVPKFQDDLERIFDRYPCLRQCDFTIEKTNISLVSVVCEGGDMCLIFHVPGKILSYNMKSGGIAVIRDGFLENVERIIPALVKGFRSYQHFESLACV